jgi:hypothetical protein
MDLGKPLDIAKRDLSKNLPGSWGVIPRGIDAMVYAELKRGVLPTYWSRLDTALEGKPIWT